MNFRTLTIHIAVFTLVLIQGSVFSQLTADFTVDDSTGCQSKIIHFINQSTGSGTLNHSWDFGNGTVSTAENPVVAYTSTGIYTVSLIVSDESQSDTLTKTDFIKIFESPAAGFQSAGSLAGCAPLTVAFTHNTVEGDAPINSFIWDFGDNHFATEENPVHDYQQTGVFTVNLTVTDTNSCISSYYLEDYITILNKPEIDFIADITKTCNDSLKASFTNVSDAGYALTYEWDFGNGESSHEQEPTTQYTAYGIYHVKLVAMGGNGCADSLTKNNYITLNELVVDIEIDQYYHCRNQQLEINNNTIGANSHTWDFGDGSSSDQALPVKLYQDTGAFEIYYIASFDAICTDTIIDSVYIDPLTAGFSTSESYLCELPHLVEYTDESVNAIAWNWSFGNGMVSDFQHPEIMYNYNSEINTNNTVVYADTLIVTSEIGCTDSIIIDSSMVIIIPDVYFTPNDSTAYLESTTGCVPLVVYFEDKSTVLNNQDPFVSRIWDFGDGNTSTQINPEHTYNIPGEYTVTLSLTNQSGCVNSYQAMIATGTPQVADFEYQGEAEICGSQEAMFFDLSTVDTLVNEWFWIFGDGKQSNDKNPLHIFVDTGYMSTQLTVKYNGCSNDQSTLFKDSVVKIKAPAGEFVYFFDCDEPLLYTLQSNVYGSDSIIWQFGDGFADSTHSPITDHQYNASGNYTITLYSYNAANDCDLSLNLPVFPRELIPAFNYLPAHNCVGDTVLFDASTTQDAGGFGFEGNYGSFLWDFDASDGIMDTITFGNAYHLYPQRGEYNVRLIVKDINNCWDTLVKIIKIYKPEAAFSLSDNIGCLPLDVSFNDLTVSDTLLSVWQWNFGNGEVSNVQNPTITYENIGFFDVQLIVEDVLGCKDTLLKVDTVLASKPQPSFSIDDPNLCFGDSLFITDNSFGNGLSYLWNFGDGNNSDESNPVHLYQNTGTYDISLYLVDTLSCDSFATYSGIYVQENPVADFLANYTSTICYPALIQFTDLSVSDHINTWKWDFGDDYQLQNNASPLHNYFIPGVFDVSLIVSTNIGCSDTIVKNNYINIGGPYADIVAPDSACINEPVLVTLENQLNLYSFEWILNDGTQINEDSIHLETNGFETVNYTLLLMSDSIYSCDKILEDSIQFPEIIAEFQLDDTAGCIPFTINSTMNSTGYEDWIWHLGNGETYDLQDVIYEYTESGEFNLKLIVTSDIQCKDSMEQVIEVFSLPEVNVSNDTLICRHDSIRIYASGGVSYLWSGSNEILNPNIFNPTVFPSISSKYHVMVTDTNACFQNDSVFVQVQQLPISQIKNEDTVEIIIGEEINMIAVDSLAYNYRWFPEDVFSCVQCNDAFARPLESGFLFYEVSDENECFIVRDSVYAKVDHKHSLDMPNAFTPNGDGLNDRVSVKGWGIKELIDFKVYDSYGKLVFSTNDINHHWEGTDHGNALPLGVYYYTVTVLNYDNIERRKSGKIHLLK